MLWTGSDDGLVHISRNDGGSWDDVTPKGAPEWATVVAIEASRFDAGTAYVVFDAHRLDDETPYIWKTTNYGYTWIDLSRDLDSETYLKMIREDTKKEGLLFLGTERGVMVSHNGGTKWESLRLNMPTVAIADLAVAGDDLIVGSLGRAAYALDDLTPLREMSSDIENEAAYLFKPLDGIRWIYSSGQEGGDSGSTSNPDRGVTVTYYLGEEPEDDISLEILNDAGDVIRTLTSIVPEPYLAPYHPDARVGQESSADLTKNEGLNRAPWNLTHEGATEIQGSTNDAGRVNFGPMVTPGEYTARLVVGGEMVEQDFSVLPDPRSDAPIENLRIQNAFLLAVRDRISAVSEDAIRIRAVRDQLEAHHARLEDDPTAARLVTLGEEALGALREVDLVLYNPDAKVNYDILRGEHGGAKLYSRYGWLYGSSIDHKGPPTQGMSEVDAELIAIYEEAKVELERILSEDIGRINSLASELGVDYVVN